MKGMKTNLIFLVILAIIVMVFLWDKEATKEREAKEEREEQLTLLGTDEVTEVKVVNRLEDIVARKEGDNWRIVEPIDFPGDSSNWNSLVSSIAGGKRQRVLVSDPEDLAAYGLQDPSVEVTLKGVKKEEGSEEDEGEEIVSTIAFGNETPTQSGKYYAFIKNSSDVVTVMTSVFNNADKSLYDFRDKTVLSLESDEVQKVDIQHSELDVVLQKSQGDWVISKPISARANGTLIDDLVNQVSNSEVQQFIEEDLKEENYEAYGLIEAATKLTFWSGEANNEASWSSKALLMGATNPSGLIYAKREAQRNVFAVSLDDYNKIPKSIDELRLKKVTPLKSWELQRVTISAGDTIFETSKSGGDWILQQPQEGTAVYNDVSSLNRDIVGLEVDEFVVQLPEGISFDSPAATITLETDEATDTIVFAEAPDENAYIGKRENPTEYFKVETSKLDTIINKASNVSLEEQEEAGETEEPSEDESLPEESEVPISIDSLPQNLTEDDSQ